MYQSLHPTDFHDDKVFIAWALACINNDSKAASWKAHWLTLCTENILAGRLQPITLTNWDAFAREFLRKFIDPLETQRMQRHLVEMQQKMLCRDHTQEFNQMALLAGMNGNQALPWLFRQSLKNNIAIIYRIFPQFPDEPPIAYDALQHTSAHPRHLRHDYYHSR